MEFIYKNFLDTTSALVVNSNTAGAQYMMSTDLRQQYISSGFNNDSTTATIRINFSSTKTVSRIVLANMNWKQFRCYYNGTTASTFALTTTSATTTANFSTNSETSMYLFTTPVACTSVSFDVYSTQVANVEKAVGWVVVSDVLLDFEADGGRIPNSSNYKPQVTPERVEHKMADGGTRIHFVRDVFSANVKFDNVGLTFTSALREVYDLQDEFIFAAFPTSTSWDKVAFPCVWSGGFDFLEYSDDAAASGFSGSIRLKQTSV